MGLLDKWYEDLGDYASRCWLPANFNGTNLWLILTWTNEESWQLRIHPRLDNDKPGPALCGDLFAAEGLQFTEEDLPLAEAAAWDVSKEWLTTYWPEVQYEGDGADFATS